MTATTYYFDGQPFEQDALSHLFTNLARSSVDAAQAHGADRKAVAQVMGEAIVRELRIIFPSVPLKQIEELAARMPAALGHPAFGAAWFEVRERSFHQSSVMALPAYPAPAIVMAALGVPPALLSVSHIEPLLAPTLDVDLLLDVIGDRCDIMIGFEPARTPFYYLVSASARSLRRCLDSDPSFAPVRSIIPLDSMMERAGPHGVWGVHPKAPNEHISSILHSDNPALGMTTVFIGGWMEDGRPRDDGSATYQPMPMRILEHMMRHGTIAMIATRALDAPPKSKT